MTLEELIETYPEVETYFKNMPEELKTIRKTILWIISGSYAAEITG